VRARARRLDARGGRLGLRRGAQRGAEGHEPHEDEAEADDLERCEGDEAEHEDDDRRHEHDRDAGGDEAQSPRRPRACEHDDEDAEERQHRARRAALVQRRVDVERYEPDEGEVRPERGDEHDESAREVGVGVHGVFETVQDHRELLAHPCREDDEQAAGRHRADVERHAREVSVSPQLAEVQSPPLGVGRRRGGDRRAECEQHDGRDREVAGIHARSSEEVDGIDHGRHPRQGTGHRLEGRRHRLTTQKRSGRTVRP